ncbi:hypothetical protein UG56_004700 [Nocardioides luteus]|uniref:Uncharacterized protein n=1 Tax=Nocardioides luteus TaxID=1844 RepID=A0A1J4N8Z3_9ACTN|nr:hypothetical protein UG56_004700 [Nocardioides luteus]
MAGWGDGLVDHQAGYRLSDIRADGGRAGRVRFELESGQADIAELTSWYWSADLRYFERAVARPMGDGAWEATFPDSPGGPGHLVVAFDSGDEEIGDLVLGSDLVAPQGKRRPSEARVSDGDVQKVGGYDVTLSGDLLLAQPSTLTLSVASAGKQVRYAEAEIAAVSIASGAFARFEAGPDGTFSGTPSSPGRFRVVVDVVIADQQLHAVFERAAFG